MNRILAFLFFVLFLAGMALLVLRDMAPPDSGTESRSVAASLADGDWHATDGSGANVRFETDGKVSGSGGCNRFFGSYSASGSTIRLGPLGSTKMACAEDLMNSETRFFEALQSATRYRIDGDRLRLGNDGGDLLTLQLAAVDAEQPGPEN